MSQNGFLVITNLCKTIQTSSLVATPTKSGMPRRSKGSKHDFKIFIFPGPICFRSRLFVVFVFLVASIFEPCFEGFKSQNIDRRTRLEKSYPTNYFLSPTELRSPSYDRFYVYVFGPVFCRSRLLSRPTFFCRLL